MLISNSVIIHCRRRNGQKKHHEHNVKSRLELFPLSLPGLSPQPLSVFERCYSQAVSMTLLARQPTRLQSQSMQTRWPWPLFSLSAHQPRILTTHHHKSSPAPPPLALAVKRTNLTDYTPHAPSRLTKRTKPQPANNAAHRADQDADSMLFGGKSIMPRHTWRSRSGKHTHRRRHPKAGSKGYPRQSSRLCVVYSAAVSAWGGSLEAARHTASTSWGPCLQEPRAANGRRAPGSSCLPEPQVESERNTAQERTRQATNSKQHRISLRRTHV